jgi:hypothetical protein
MTPNGIRFEHRPNISGAIVVAGFDGWGNALGVSTGMAAYLIRHFAAQPFAELDADQFFHFSRNRPMVKVADGRLEQYTPSGGRLYHARIAGQPEAGGDRHLVVLKSDEPTLRWGRFAEAIFDLAGMLEAEAVITVGSMFDQVLHTDRIISAIGSPATERYDLFRKNVRAVNYNGPSAVHSAIQAEGDRRNVPCFSLWCHCPYYLKGITHFGLLSNLAALIGEIGRFAVETADLENRWLPLRQEIEKQVAENPELESAIAKLRLSQIRGEWEMASSEDDNPSKVIRLKDYLETGPQRG